MEKLLEKLNKKHDLILITARKNKGNCERQLQFLKINKYFSKIYIVDNTDKVSNAKAEILIKDNASLMVGDTEIDRQAADIAKIKFHPVYNGFRNKKLITKK